MQSALLYTTTDGARRIRVSTVALPVVDQMGAVFKGADLDSQVLALTRQVSGLWRQSNTRQEHALLVLDGRELSRQASPSLSWTVGIWLAVGVVLMDARTVTERCVFLADALQVAIQLPGNTFAQGRDTVSTRITSIL